jgi:hypothetical protein
MLLKPPSPSTKNGRHDAKEGRDDDFELDSVGGMPVARGDAGV